MKTKVKGLWANMVLYSFVCKAKIVSGKARIKASVKLMEPARLILSVCEASQPIDLGTLQIPQLSPFNEKIWALL